MGVVYAGDTLETTFTLSEVSTIVDRVKQQAARIEHLEAALLGIALTDHHYRTPPAPKPDGGMRGWAGLCAVRALTGKHGSYTSDDDLREAMGLKPTPAVSESTDGSESPGLTT